MTEEINNLNTDLKELFVNTKYEEIIEVLNKTDNAIVLEITSYNYNIIKKYYDEQKFTLLLQFIKFVAYTSFLSEYATKRQLISTDEYDAMVSLFESINELKKNSIIN